MKLIPAPKEVVSLVCPFGDLSACISAVIQFKKAHMNPQALEFFERDILISSEEYLGRAVFPRTIEGEEVGAYLLVTFDAEDKDAVDALMERGAELALEAGAMDVLVADTPVKMKDAWSAAPPSWRGSRSRPSCWTSAMWWSRSAGSLIL